MKIQHTEAYKRYALNSDIGEFFDIDEAEEEMEDDADSYYDMSRDDSDFCA